MTRQSSTQSRTLQVVFLITITLIFAALFISIFAASSPSTRSPEVVGFLNSQTMPFEPLIPSYLPSRSRFLSDQEHSFYDTASNILTLRWVYPAQTLPGQGTLIVYQALSDSAAPLPKVEGERVEFNTQSSRHEGRMGSVVKTDDVPASPGERALATRVGDLEIVVVAYAISDRDLIKIVESLQNNQ